MTPVVKICGITRVEDAERAAALGADFLGLNFHPPSPRCVAVDVAREIAESVRGRVGLVGVFVNRPIDEVEEVGERVGLDLFQFHGDESAESIAPLAGRAIKALRVGDVWSESELAGFEEVWGFLVESRHPTLYGGSGESWGYERLAAIDFPRPVLVAGGIRPETARAALEASRVRGVDVCSGVESEPGIKDSGKLERLFAGLHMADAV